VADEPHTLCEGCRQEIDPQSADTVQAVELVPVPGQGTAAGDVAEGLTMLFHDGCYPGDEGFPGGRRYKRV
jgi:hypothetical protein